VGKLPSISSVCITDVRLQLCAIRGIQFCEWAWMHTKINYNTRDDGDVVRLGLGLTKSYSFRF